MSKIFKNLEKRKIEEIVKEYKKNDYIVYINPDSNVLPDFFRDVKPDVYAIKDDENVIIEVATKESYNKKIEQLSKIIENKPNWRFDLIITNPKDKNIFVVSEDLLTNDEIYDRINQIKLLINQNLTIPSFLLTWSLFEAKIRNKAIFENIDENKPILSLIKTFYSIGIIENKDLIMMKDFLKLKNKIIHGYSLNIDMKDIKKFFKYVTKF